jgi:hypothetical protein
MGPPSAKGILFGPLEYKLVRNLLQVFFLKIEVQFGQPSSHIGCKLSLLIHNFGLLLSLV